ncbi:MAG: gamma-glutamyl-gamma-aminobutyrate hydrolase family protein [Gemmatimonadales bacterium]
MTRPLIGVTGTIRRFESADRASVNAAYLRALAAAGANPVLLTPVIPTSDAGSVLQRMQGLVITGGHDVDPCWYNARPSPALGAVDRARDAFDLALFRTARSLGLPVLGICRGLQVINVALGGTLWQDLPSEMPGPVKHDPPDTPRNTRVHGIRVDPASRLAAALGSTRFRTNSFHHQAVRELAPGLMATAWADDGVIEGVEGPASDPWLLAVQWHPEEFVGEPESEDQRLFVALVEASERIG